MGTNSPEVKKTLEYVFIGVLSGMALGVFGSGSGAIAVPLVIISGIDPMAAKGSALTGEIVASIGGGIIHRKQGNFKRELSAALLLGIIGAFSGAYLSGHVPAGSSKIMLGIYEIFAGIVLIGCGTRNVIDVEQNTGYLYAAIIGLLAGFVKGFLGTGWGPIGVTLLILFGALPKKVVGSSLFARVLISSTAALTYLVAGHVMFGIVWALSAGGLIGVAIGAFVTRYVEERHVKKLIGSFVLALGIYILYRTLG